MYKPMDTKGAKLTRNDANGSASMLISLICNSKCMSI
jgi:hypothetical protein